METSLYLIPNVLHPDSFGDTLPQHVKTVTATLRQFFVEDIRAARRFLSRMSHPLPMEQLQFFELNEHTSVNEISSFLPLLQADNSGIISDAGVPAVADPGASLIKTAHDHNIRVVPLAGPSSILMALMASGLNGQSFAFNGYLPVRQNDRIARIRTLERRSGAEGQTQIFIETPYRNMQLLEDLIACCKLETLLCVAANITATDEYISTRSIRRWKGNLPPLHKQPAVFCLQAVTSKK
ncbi:MAG: SAM-dependent methyltransferase [Bacteroidales bacterium]|jgi:16S rRNA (cytidine1402-2'-O)-methyltransferase|nr:SAM-dependent methyltransferase [Bacteroidales bacterium]